MTARIAVSGVLLALLSASAGCTRVLEEPPETIESFAVDLDFEPTALAAAGCGTTLPDQCPEGRGSMDAPMNYAHDGYLTFLIDVEAIGSRGTRPLPWDGEVGVRLPRGSLHPQLDRVVLAGGRATGVRVRLRRVAGSTAIFVEDRLEGKNDTPPTFAVGSSDKLFFTHPTIAQLQETQDEGISALHKNHVELTSGLMFVTRVAPNGFNIQDLLEPAWGGLFVYAYNGVEGLARGSQLFSLAGGVTEFLGGTQIQSPIYSAPNIRCESAIGESEGFEDTDVDESGLAMVASCPEGTTCTPLEEERGEGTVRVHRCAPNQAPGAWDRLGRLRCSQDSDPVCPTGTTCLLDQHEQQRFCQVVPVAPPAEAWPQSYDGELYCGPRNSGRNLPLVAESFESRLVQLTSDDGEIRVEGLPLCLHTDDFRSVASSCHPSDDVPDCPLARAGEPLLRDPDGNICYRPFEACLDDGVPYTEVQSTCVMDPSLPYCTTDGDYDEPLRDANGVVCRNTLNDFIWGGWVEFNQWKVSFQDASGIRRCATIGGEALVGFDPFALQEGVGTLRSITGTMRQVRFASGSSYWIIDVRDPSDLEH